MKRLSHYLNSMKEDFATARYLYYTATEREAELASLSANVYYLDTLDYAHFGLDSGLLKACLRLATDSLDKIGGFLNEYFSLGNRPEYVVFNNVWFDRLRAGKQTNPILDSEMETNCWLRALRELQRDWYRETFPGPLRSARNLATHSKFVLYLEGEGWSAYRLEELLRFILRQVKAAIIYLVCAVEAAERRKLKGKKTLTLPLYSGPGLADQFHVDDERGYET